MTITLKFQDRELTHSNAKAARAYLRKNGMNVRQATKDGDIWYFDFALASKVAYTTTSKPKPAKPKSKPLKTITKPKPQPIDHSPTQEIHNLPVLGSDLQAGDVLVNFASGYDLTINYKGVHEIVIEAPNVTRTENRFRGFYSEESGGLLSYVVDSKTTYDVVRKE